MKNFFKILYVFFGVIHTDSQRYHCCAMMKLRHLKRPKKELSNLVFKGQFYHSCSSKVILFAEINLAGYKDEKKYCKPCPNATLIYPNSRIQADIVLHKIAPTEGCACARALG